jgi:hypothetical protein
VTERDEVLERHQLDEVPQMMVGENSRDLARSGER